MLSWGNKMNDDEESARKKSLEANSVFSTHDKEFFCVKVDFPYLILRAEVCALFRAVPNF